MKFKFLLMVLPFVLLTSCEEKVDHAVNIYIQNKTSTKLTVKLTPTISYRGSIGNKSAYLFSSYGNGYRYCDFEIDTGASAQLFTNSGFSESSSQVANKAFEEIQVTLKNEQNTMIHFYHDSATNYKSNIFSDDAVWIFTSYMINFPTQLNSNPTESHDYYFVIDEKNLINK